MIIRTLIIRPNVGVKNSNARRGAYTTAHPLNAKKKSDHRNPVFKTVKMSKVFTRVDSVYS